MRKLSNEELKAENARHLLQPMAHPGTVREAPPDIIVRGDGSWIWDVDGHRLIDGVGGLWCANLGFGRKEIRDAIVAQLDELPFFNTFRGATHPRAIELSQRLVASDAAGRRRGVHFSSGGSDAVDSALKLARQYWKLQRSARPHQVHLAASGLSRRALRRRERQRQHAVSPRLRAVAAGMLSCRHTLAVPQSLYAGPRKLGKICAELLEREILFQSPDTVAAFIAEPIQGAGGVIVPPPNYWPLVRRDLRQVTAYC